MRIRRRWVALSVAVAVIAWQWPAFCHFVTGLRFTPDRSFEANTKWKLDKLTDAMVSEVYCLESDRWLTFDLPAGHAVLRLLSTADLPDDRRAALPTPLPATAVWTYAVRYQLLDASGTELCDRELHFQTRLTEIADPKSEATVTPAFYLGEPTTPADSRLAVVPLTGHRTTPVRLRVRLGTADPPLFGVAVRVLHRDPTEEFKLRYSWDRTLPDKQRRLAAGNVFPAELLNDEERRNLFRNRWGPIAPHGRPGIEFHQRHLYVLNETEGEPVRDRPPPTGLLAGPGRVAVIPLPDGGGAVRLLFTPVSAGDPSAGSIELRWYGVGRTKREMVRVPWAGREATFEKSFAGDSVEVVSPATVAVRAFRAGGRTTVRRSPLDADEITPPPSQTWSYLLRGADPVDFDILHAAAEATPVRVDVRRLLADPPPATASARFQFLDAAGRVIRDGELASDLPASAYDRVRWIREEYAVSEPNTFNFSAPAAAVRLRFAPADAPLLVSVSNRPGALANLTQVPEDYFRFNRPEVRQRNWFPLRCPAHDRLELANRVPVLTTQPRPPADDPDIAAGRYEWQQFLPGGDWTGRELLVPRDPAAPYRDEALPATFRELATDTDSEITFRGAAGRAEVRPAVVYSRDADDPFTLSVWVGGKLHHTEKVDGSRGEVALPAVGVGPKSVRVTTSAPAKVYLNASDPGPDPALVKRMAVQLTGVPLTFAYEKTDRARQAGADEVLSFTLHRPAGATDRVRVRVRLEGVPDAAVGPFPTWTFRDRVFDLRPAGGDPLPVLGTRAERVDPGQPFLFPIGADLPPGQYRVRVEPETAFAGYLLFGRSLPGAYDRREFFHEHPGRVMRGGGGP